MTRKELLKLASDGATARLAQLKRELDILEDFIASTKQHRHWTQTKAGKAKMAAAQRKAWKTRKAR